MSSKLLKIGDLAKTLNLSTDTLRFYEKHQLLTPAARSENGYRLYSSDEHHRLAFIISAKAVGFTLQEIKELLALEVKKDRISCATVKSYVDEKIAQLNARIDNMQSMRNNLQSLSDACCGGEERATECTILQVLNDNPPSFYNEKGN